MSIATAPKPYRLASGEGLADVWWKTGRITVKAGPDETGNAFSQFVVDDPRGSAPPFHVHHNEDEAFYILEGKMTVFIDGGRVLRARPGMFVHIPRGTAHGFRPGRSARRCFAGRGRARFVGIKLLTGAATGAALMLVTLVAVASTAVIWLGLIDVPLELGDGLHGAGRAFVGVALAGLLGAAIGGAVHSQVGSLVGTLVWIFVAEPICWALLGLLDLDGVASYLPAAALGGVVDSSGEGLPFAGSVGMTLAWAVVAAALALVRTGRRDIT